jgi:hypothetical protein
MVEPVVHVIIIQAVNKDQSIIVNALLVLLEQIVMVIQQALLAQVPVEEELVKSQMVPIIADFSFTKTVLQTDKKIIFLIFQLNFNFIS